MTGQYPNKDRRKASPSRGVAKMGAAPRGRGRGRMVFLISRFLDGGIDTALVEYLNAIDLREWDVMLVIGVKYGGLEVHLPRIKKGVRIEYLVTSELLAGTGRRKLKGEATTWEKAVDQLFLNPLRKWEVKSKLGKIVSGADLVVDFDSTFYTPLGGILRRLGSKAPVSAGYYHFSLGANLKVNPHHTRRQMRGMKVYDRIVMVCRDMVEEATRLFPELEGKFTCIYNGYDLEQYRDFKELPENEKPRRPYFLQVSRLEESQKDLTTLIKGYALFRKRFVAERPGEPFPQLQIAGKGRDEARLKKLAADCGVGDDVVFAGFVKDPRPLVAGAEGVFLSSHYEGFGLVLAEAQILGRGVAATECPVGPAEILERGEAGILLRPGSAEDVAEAMRVFATDPERHRQLEAASLAAGRRFDIKRSVGKLLGIVGCR